jgi:hypothetical protein
MPGTYFGPYSERYNDYDDGGNANVGRFPLGHTLILPDGREHKFALNDGTVEVAGNLYQSVVGQANHTTVACDVARAIGDTQISATLGATAAAIDIYAEGNVHINDADGQGYNHRIKRARAAGDAHAAVLSSGIITVNLESDEEVQVALTTSSEVSFSRNRYHQVLIHPSPPTGGLAGVSPGVAAANRFYWSQVKGYAAVLVDGTLLEGLPVQASIAINGAIESLKRRVRTGGTTIAVGSVTTQTLARLIDQDGTTTDFLVIASTTSAGATMEADISGPIAINAPPVGRCIKVNADTEYGLVELDIQ